jgi:plastocyanin
MPASVTADISGFKFVPATITVSVGSTLTWTNLDGAAHTVTSDTDLFESGSLRRNDPFNYTFDQSGTFTYFCRFHPYMKGEVVVE